MLLVPMRQAGAEGARDRRSDDRRRWHQSLYRKRDFTWADAGIHASSRVINRKFDLDRNYRNTAEILRAARTFAVPPGSGMQSVLALPVEPDTAIRSGPEPWLIRLDDAASEMHYAAALIETWLRAGLEIGWPQRSP